MTKFANPENIIAQVGMGNGAVVVDFGCGSGFFTLPAAKLSGNDGTVYAVDILQDKLAVTQSSSQHAGFKNVTVVQADLAQPLTEIPEATADYVIMSNIVHQVDRGALLKNAYRVLKTGGKVLIVDWKKGYTPFGPPQELRVAPEDLEHECTKVGLRKEKNVESDGYHYALLFIK